MSSEWKTSSLLDHYDVRSGLSKPAKDFGSGFPFLTFKDVFYNYFAPERLGDLVQSTEKDRAACSVRRGDVFLTRTSETMHELGMSCVALKDYPGAAFNGFCKRLRPKPDCRLVPEYVGYYLRSPAFRQAMLAMSTMSTRASLNNEMIGRLEISFPSVDIQVRIAAILKSLDDRMVLLRETNATLEAIAQALFKSWFVDFDPVLAKQQGRAPEGMDEATAALFPDSFEESELGLVPKGWRVGAFSDLVHQHKGALNPLNHPDIVFEHYSLPAFDSGQMPVFEAGTEIKSNKTSVPSSAVLLSKLNPHISRVWMPASAGATAVCSTEFLVFTPVGSSSKEFVYCGFSAPEFQQLLCQQVTGTSNSHQRVKPDGVLSMRRIVPPSSVLASFEAATRPVFERIGHNRQQAQTLASLRDTLLPRLISGQLRLPEAEAFIDEALA